ncbi:MAG TPA: UDP-3-O-acyl-N-acetylglucosamine deacetylase [Thermoanaerobaculia bacterium]|nr:UDP-3-O-acyl-N-acetylglucosamine deacetylase [Thermoanaerobaculia bacterium]
MRNLGQSRLFQQNTLASPTSIEGVGIHTGRWVRVNLRPAPPDSGILFRRLDAGGVEVPALASHVCSLELATTIGRDDVTISTIEHLMAALQLARVDNAILDIDGPEVPILDGSALPYFRLIEAAGVRPQRATRKILAITEPVETAIGERRIRISPYPGLRVSYLLDYAIPSIGRQSLDVRIDGDTVLAELAPARTFALLDDVRRMQQNGLALGGTEDNCVVFDDSGPINTTLRYADEPVRHKALDAVGDLALIGSPVWGHLEVERGGHLLHYKLIEALQANSHCWSWVRAESSQTGAGFEITDLASEPKVLVRA